MHPTRFLQGDAYEVYNRVFVPLAEQARIIDRTDKSLLSIKLRTIYEFEPRRIQVNCLTINQDYNSEVPKVWLQAKMRLARTLLLLIHLEIGIAFRSKQIKHWQQLY